jgi:hypothetical protein
MRSRFLTLAMLASGIFLSTTGAGLAISGLTPTNDASQAQYGTPGTQPVQPGASVEPNEAPTLGTLPERADNQPADDAVKGVQDELPEGDAPSGDATQPLRQLTAGASGRDLPFTGYAAIPILLIGVALLVGGFVLRRSATRPT